MAFDTRNLTTDYKKLMSIPVMNRTTLAQSGLLNDMLSMLTPTQYSSLFPSYYKEGLPSISGFETSVTRTTMSGGGGTTGGATGGGTGYTAGTGSSVTATPVKPSITPSQQRAAEKAGLGYLLPDQKALPQSSQQFKAGENASEIQKGIVQIANRFNMDPVDVATFMRYETGGTLDPYQPGPITQWGQHRGLIQMGEVQQKEYGINLDPRRGPVSTIAEQFAAIEKYFVANKFDKWLADNPNATVHQKRLAMYATVNAGSPYKVDATDQYNGGAPGTVIDKVNDMYDTRKGSHYNLASEYMKSAEVTPADLNQINQGQGVPQGTSDVFPADQQNMTGKITKENADEVVSATVAGEIPLNQAVINKALEMKGVVEVKDRQRIAEYLKTGGVGLDPVETSWCAAFVNSTLQQKGIQGSGSQVATSFGNWGVAVEPNKVQSGDVLVEMRGLNPGDQGGHVGFATGNTRVNENTGALEYEFLSGNSGKNRDSVTTRYISADKVSARRATEIYENQNNQATKAEKNDAQNVLDIVPKSDVLPPEQQQMAPTAEPVTEATPADTPSELNAVNNYETGTANAGYAEEVKMVDNKTGQTIGNVGTGEAVGITKDNKVAVTSEARLNASQILPKMNMNMSNPNAQSMPQNGPQVDPTRSRQVASAVNNLDPMRLTADNSFEPSPSFDRSMGRVVESGNKYNSRGVPWSNV